MAIGMASTRREILKGGAATIGGAALSRVVFARAETEQRFVLLILRGGMDGLSALAPVGDPDFVRERRAFAEIVGGARPLDGFFALHPALAPLERHWRNGHMTPIHALATSHRGRSHFEGQDVLESGVVAPNSASTGWVNRLAGLLPGSGDRLPAIALGASVPYALRGPTRVGSAQTPLPIAVSSAFIERATLLWNDDPVLGPALAAGEAGPRMAGTANAYRGGEADIALAKLAAERLAAPGGPRIAVLEQNGWDTHSAQINRFQRQAETLAAMLAALADGLAGVWRNTAVLAVSEFGRTVRPNGAGGTDHGTAGAAFLLGGNVRGGRVLADWPGLARAQQHEGRDLKPTLDVRALYKGIAAGHFGVDSPSALAELCPDATGVAPLALFG